MPHEHNHQREKPRISLSKDIPADKKPPVNEPCHGYGNGVSWHGGHVTPNPQVFIIYWDSYFSATPAAVTSMNQFVSDLVTGNYMNRLSQYSVGRGEFIGSTVIDMTKYPAPASLTRDDLQLQLTTWFGNGTVPVVPAGNEVNRVYLILPPSASVLLLNGITGFCGYHSHGKYVSSTNDDNLFWAVVQGYSPSDDGHAFVDSISYCVSHELAETFSNRDGLGFYANDNGCEIGDICEVGPLDNILTMPYQGTTSQWQVELYWSNVDQACVLGSPPGRLLTTVTPLPADQDPLNQPGEYTVHAEVVQSHATVVGWVRVGNEVVGLTDRPFTHTFRSKKVRRKDDGIVVLKVLLAGQHGTVEAPTYSLADTDWGFDEEE